MKNKRITSVEDGKTYWVTDRMVGCAMFLYRQGTSGIEVCIVKRTSKVSDQPDRWCCPCGYLDGDETGEECACRELFEETGIKISPEKVSLVDVSTSPKEHKQHVCLRYAHMMDEVDNMFNATPEIIDRCEICEVRWVNIRDLNKYNLVFNHAESCINVLKSIISYGIINKIVG